VSGVRSSRRGAVGLEDQYRLAGLGDIEDEDLGPAVGAVIAGIDVQVFTQRKPELVRLEILCGLALPSETRRRS
jgi:hypothetical protein